MNLILVKADVPANDTRPKQLEFRLSPKFKGWIKWIHPDDRMAIELQGGFKIIEMEPSGREPEEVTS